MLTAGPFTVIFKPADAVNNLNIGTVASANRLYPGSSLIRIKSCLPLILHFFDTSLDSVKKRIILFK